MAAVVVVVHLEKMMLFFLHWVVEGEGGHLRAYLGLWVMAAGYLQALGLEGRKTGTPLGEEEGFDVCPAGWGVEQKVRNLTVALQVDAVVRWESCAGVSEMRAVQVGVQPSQEKDVRRLGVGVCFLLGCWVLGISPLKEASVVLLL